ncbi:MAG: class I SAM-dependent rRNA methyltransferase [Bacteroidales bacterium]|nr:class I SAM-dependent rRNA methyltransferase [Bacteroidales bacterium]
MSRPQLIIAPHKGKAVLRRHPWIFSGAVQRMVGQPQEGDVVDVLSADGRWLAAGHYQDDNIVCKVLSFDTPEVGTDLLRSRIAAAVAYRRRLGLFDQPGTNVFRLVHAEGDLLPGLVADWYNGVLVLQAHSLGMHRLFSTLTDIFARELEPYGLHSVFDKSSATVPGGCTDGYIYGDEPAEWEIAEHGNRMLINFFEGQKTGFFIDQRDNRELVANLAGGARVLNCFGYTGGFSLGALRGGAQYVETVDVSRRAIELCNRNVALNFGPEAPHRGVVADALQYMASAEMRDRGFDFIILDPPAFAKNHRSLQQGLKGYRAINQRAMEAMPAGGLLMTFSCSQAVSAADFQTMLFTSAIMARRQVRIVRRLPHAADHPVSIYHPEGEYLKGFLLEIS